MADENNYQGAFHRQLVILPTVKEAQLTCEHEIRLIDKSTLVCVQCGAVWFK